nr:hypothetical protein CFP56_18904 [Quercus suber]
MGFLYYFCAGYPQVFVAEEWVQDAYNEATVEAYFRTETEKSLGALKREQQELATKLTAEKRTRKSAKTGLKSTQDQVEDQHKKLYLTTIELATHKQLVLDLKADLEKAKAASRMAKEVAEASNQASYLLREEETEVRLAKELAEVCRDYYKVTRVEALNLVEVPTDSKWW